MKSKPRLFCPSRRPGVSSARPTAGRPGPSVMDPGGSVFKRRTDSDGWLRLEPLAEWGAGPQALAPLRQGKRGSGVRRGSGLGGKGQVGYPPQEVVSFGVAVWMGVILESHLRWAGCGDGRPPGSCLRGGDDV
ncbi:unnamed protein product [Boreogadus saida]